MPLGELMKLADTTKPVILLDHQPFHLDETAKYGIDLELRDILITDRCGLLIM